MSATSTTVEESFTVEAFLDHRPHLKEQQIEDEILAPMMSVFRRNLRKAYNASSSNTVRLAMSVEVLDK
jgi:hypothetical protein